MGSTNLERLLTGYVSVEGVEMVATQGGGLLDMNSRVVAVISPRKGLVDLF